MDFQRSFHNPLPSPNDCFSVSTEEIFLGPLSLRLRFFLKDILNLMIVNQKGNKTMDELLGKLAGSQGG